ncbi:12086_t:CDS:2 [Racocetra persica]|uniref:12086_t:CDS:1 n=1 Tax=Racocetra persica TaxID=160502 RepID=A0ACA9PP16_9GLOM|nr:12086_t:CDS:2 [Racocetra persica]
MSKKQKITTLESNIQYENELTEGSFETTDNTIDLTENTSTEPTVELTNTSEETDLNLVSFSSRESSWVWEHFSKSTNTAGTLAKHLHNKHSSYIGNRQSTLEKFMALIQVLDQTKITEKLLGITTDNAHSMIAARRELKETLNNYELVREFVSKIRHSTRLSESLKTIYKLENKLELKPDLDIETQ